MTTEELLQAILKAAKDGVTWLDLSGKNLTSLPSEIGQLTNLRELNLAGYPLFGEIFGGNKLTSLPTEIGQLTNLRKLNLSSNQLASLPAEIGQLTNLNTLDLRDNKLTSLPAEIGQLTNLNTLDLRDNKLTSLPAEIGQLTHLSELDLRDNKLTSLPAEIGQLTNLNTLSLSGNKLTSLPAEIGQLTNLRQLNLSLNQLTSLPGEIGQLTHLNTLSLSGNKLASLPREIGQLTNLKTLNLPSNELASLPREIEQLTHLNALVLTRNQLTSLPREIGQLANLNTLDLSGNKLVSLPGEIGQLTHLNTLSLSGNKLTSLPAEIGQLANLNTLDLTDNQLTALPKEVTQLSNLRSLALSGNQLITLPPEIGQLRLARLTFGGNPLPSLPPEIRRKGFRAILNFYRQQLEQETDRLYEAKLLIVGEGGAGKTTLAKKIQDPNYQLQQDEDSTQGIDVIQWHFPLSNGREFQINIWDFGGQEIYHATHQFFLTKRSLYTLVVDTRKEDTDFYYWLNVVELLSDSSPLLIINNEKQDRHRVINERQLRGEFTNLKETLATNLANNRGLSGILTTIKHYISNLPHVGTELPKTWIKVRDALEHNPRDYISLEEYLNICQENGFTNLEDKLQLSGYLHDLGVCLHFQDDDLLIKTVILKPTWGTDAVYKVLDNWRVIQNLGEFNRNDLANIWHEDKYTTMRAELLRLMMNFKLCYEIPSCPGTYIAPQLLSPNQPEYGWDESDNLLLRYEYEFMPKGILTRFIVEMHSWIEGPTRVWKSGVVLSKDQARAEVIEYYRYHKGEIRIRVSGRRKRDFLVTVMHELEKIHHSYERLRYSTLVPCNCPTCNGSQAPHFYRLQVLHKFLDDRQDQIQCQNSYQMVKVRRLIDDIEPDHNLLKQRHAGAQQDITEVEQQLRNLMSDSSKYSIKADVVQIVESNQGEVIAKKYASDPNFAEAITEVIQILKTLQQNHPTATEPEAHDIIDAEFEEIRTNQPNKWLMLRRQLLNQERWFNGGKAALSETAKHYVEGNVFYKAGLAFLDGFSADEDQGE
jgi:Leucine-rich repeat (LRR) protein